MKLNLAVLCRCLYKVQVYLRGGGDWISEWEVKPQAPPPLVMPLRTSEEHIKTDTFIFCIHYAIQVLLQDHYTHCKGLLYGSHGSGTYESLNSCSPC